MKISGFIFTLCLWQLFFPAFADAQKHTIRPSGAGSWETHSNGVTFSLTQILPEQVKAFYVNRGFTLKQIDDYASSCVYMTVLRNENAPGTIHFITDKWTVIVDGKPHSPVSVNQWIKSFRTENINKAALIAFRWGQFPPEQSYEPGGDWNQGMFSIGLSARQDFDITVRWGIDGQPYQATLKGVHCD